MVPSVLTNVTVRSVDPSRPFPRAADSAAASPTAVTGRAMNISANTTGTAKRLSSKQCLSRPADRRTITASTAVKTPSTTVVAAHAPAT